MSDIEAPVPSVEHDVMVIDSGGTPSSSDEFVPQVIVKNEPVDDGTPPRDMSQVSDIVSPPSNDDDFPPLPELGSPVADEDDFLTEDLVDVDDDFEKSMALAQQQFNQQSLPEAAPSTDGHYEHALNAVERKRTEVAERRSLGIDTTADEIELQRLEDKLSLARKNKMRAEQHVQQERQQSSLFFPEGGEEGESDDEIELSPAPPRREAAILIDDPLAIDISDDEEEQEIKAKVKTGQKRKHPDKPPAPRKVAKKQTSNRRGPRREIEMLNMGSLIRNDIVKDAKTNQGLRQQPSLGASKDKAKALKALIASIPEDERSIARGEKQELSKACSVFCWKGRGSMKADGVNGWKLKGMSSSLRHFQLLSVAKGVEKERGSTAPFGGMLADTMGYGKMIAMMVENQPNALAKNRTTLIVVPASITTQWLEEIAKHVDDGIMENVFIYKAGSRPPDQETVRFLKRQQVVITTYHEVMRNYPKSEPPIHLATDAAKDAWWAEHYEKNKGPLLQIKFHRIILDEAQAIKNHESRTSKSCRQLSAKYKWVLSGTPLSNRMEEMFPYFHFLGVEGSATFSQFQHNYAKRNDKTMQRLDMMLRAVMIRRTGSSRLFGAPLVSLPALDHQTIIIDFNPVERAIYTVVRQRFISRINDWSRSNNKVTQISKNILVMLTRLRQMCAHVLMVSTTMKGLLESEDIEKLWKSIERHSNSSNEHGKKTGNILRRILKEARDEDVETGATPAPTLVDDHDTIDLTIDDNDFDYRTFFYQLQRDGLWEKIKSRSSCCICNKVPEEEDARLSVPCGHLYCEACIDQLLESARRFQTEAECVSCQNPISDAADLQAMDQIANEARQKRYRSAPQQDDQSKKKGRKTKQDPDLKWLNAPGVDKLSSKAQAVESTIAEWIKEDPNAKIVIFTLWIPMIRIFAKVCARRGWGYSEYTGKQSADQRNRNLYKFKSSSPEEQRVLLMSTKTGGTGLNLVEASYCCMVDPWWNEPVEDQAYSRIYRIGQPKDCVVRRFLIKDAIDTQLMLWLQRVKAEECERVIDGRSAQKLTIKDMMEMFGPTKKDTKTGETIIEDERDAGEDFIISDEKVVIDDSEDEQVMPAPARPREE